MSSSVWPAATKWLLNNMPRIMHTATVKRIKWLPLSWMPRSLALGLQMKAGCVGGRPSCPWDRSCSIPHYELILWHAAVLTSFSCLVQGLGLAAVQPVKEKYLFLNLDTNRTTSFMHLHVTDSLEFKAILSKYKATAKLLILLPLGVDISDVSD